MSTSMNVQGLVRDRLWIKWAVALLVPVLVFTFLWNGDLMVNQFLATLFNGGSLDTSTIIQGVIFLAVFYLTVVALAGYFTAIDSGKRGMIELWVEVFFFVLTPLLLVILTSNLIIGLAVSVIIWALYLNLRTPVYKLLHYAPPVAKVDKIQVFNEEQRATLRMRAISGSFWFAALLALIWLVIDVIFYFSGSLPFSLLIWGIARTVLLPVVGYFLGVLSGRIAMRRVFTPKDTRNGAKAADGSSDGVDKRREMAILATSRASEEAKDLVPNDLPLRSTGARNFYLIILVAFLLFYPVIDPFLFSFGTAGRLAGYGDAGYYVILALGLNIVVGFAGLLDLGYVAFFAIGAYAWGMIGSPQLSILTNTTFLPHLASILFWPMLLGAGLIAAFWGVVLGAPTLRLRGDYLAIVTLGFGEIVPVIFLNLRDYTNGTNGLVGIRSPSFFGLDWTSVTPVPYYYLILALIVFTIFANVRLRDSRLGRAWIAIREDEIAAASSGVNLVATKLFAFGTGAFFSGIAGMYYSSKLGTVSPDAFSFGDSVIYLAMVVIGGLGSIPGVIVGALTVYAVNLFILNQLDTIVADPSSPLYGVLHPIFAFITHFAPGFTFGNIRNLIFGVILVVIMIFRPAGLIPSARRRRELKRSEDEPAEMGSLDEPPGTAEFEAEIRVE